MKKRDFVVDAILVAIGLVLGSAPQLWRLTAKAVEKANADIAASKAQQRIADSLEKLAARK